MWCMGHAAEAKRILDTLRTDQESLASNVLAERLAACEHASFISTGNLLNIPMETLKTHLGQTCALWAKFPVKVRVQLGERFALEDFFMAIGLLQKKRQEEWEQGVQRFLAHFNWGNCAEYPEDAVDFRADTAKLLHSVEHVLHMASDCQDDGLLACFDDAEATESKPDKQDAMLQEVRQNAEATSLSAVLQLAWGSLALRFHGDVAL